MAALILLQVVAVMAYLRVEARRRARPASFAYEVLPEGRPATELTLARRGGVKLELAQLRGRPVLLHFWATWCPPCREELPGLLALARELEREGRMQVLAVALDDDWEAVSRFLGGEVPAQIVLEVGSGGHRQLGVETLPDTYLLGPDGRPIVRFAGARDWRTPAARRALAAGLEARR